MLVVTEFYYIHTLFIFLHSICFFCSTMLQSVLELDWWDLLLWHGQLAVLFQAL